MKTKIAGVALAAVMACGLGSVQRASAAYIINVHQDASGVYAVGSGSLNIQGLTLLYPNSAGLGLGAGRGVLGIGQFGGETFTFEPSPVNFGEGLGPYNVYDLSGPTVGIDATDGYLTTPTAYVSGTEIGTSFARLGGPGGTYADFGLRVGHYEIDFNSGANLDTFTVNVLPSTVPLPSSAPLFGAALLSLSGIGYARRRAKAGSR